MTNLYKGVSITTALDEDEHSYGFYARVSKPHMGSFGTVFRRSNPADVVENACVTIEFRGSELMLGIDIIGGDADTSNPIGLRVDPSLVGHKWQEADW